jgi:hypothetical protein
MTSQIRLFFLNSSRTDSLFPIYRCRKTGVNFSLTTTTMSDVSSTLLFHLRPPRPTTTTAYKSHHPPPQNDARRCGVILSDAKATAIGLDKKRLEFQSTALLRPPQQRKSFHDAWSELQLLLGNQDLPSAEDAFQILLIPFVDFDQEDAAFDLALFDAMKECLKVCLSKTNVDRDYLLLQRPTTVGENENFAIGLARQHVMARDCLSLSNVPGKRILLSEQSTNLVSYNNNRDDESTSKHAICLFERSVDDNDVDHDDQASFDHHVWKVKDCLSIVELTTSDKACADFEPDARNPGHLELPDLHGMHRALGQALLLTLDGVVPSHARRGILGKSLPVAIIAAGKRKLDDSLKRQRLTVVEEPSDTATTTTTTINGQAESSSDDVEERETKKQKSQGQLRWVFASLGIPEACGDDVTYTVHDFDHFYKNDVQAEMTSIEQALVLYIDTITFGLKSALTILGDMDRGYMRPPKPASGQVLKIGKRTLDWPLCASPIPEANATIAQEPSSGGKRSWKVAQGELFTGTLNVHDVFDDFLYVNFFESAPKESVKVVVKVSSPTVHFLLVDPAYAYSALERINYFAYCELVLLKQSNDGVVLEKTDSDKVKLIQARRVLVQEMASVLYAAIKTKAGMITIMSDLSTRGYGPLSAAHYKDQLSVLWKGFEHLVMTVMLPMARKSIIHCDIRPGFDETSNILCKIEGEGTEAKASLKLIDYESVIDIADWDVPCNSGNYIKSEPEWTATTFVWWQCVAVAYAWKREIPAETFFNHNGEKGNNNALVLLLKQELKSLLPVGRQIWRYTSINSQMSEEMVAETLDDLAKLFCSSAS